MNNNNKDDNENGMLHLAIREERCTRGRDMKLVKNRTSYDTRIYFFRTGSRSFSQ